MHSPRRQFILRQVPKSIDNYCSDACSSSSEGESSRFTSGPLIPDVVELTKPVKCEKTIFSDGTTPIPMSASRRKAHPPHFPTGTTEVLTFYPTMDEFRDFKGYIEKIEKNGAHLKCGIAKIVPPEGWTPRPGKRDFLDVDNYEINSPVEESIEGKSGVYYKSNKVYRRKMIVKDFKKLANSAKYRNPKPGLEGADLEDYFFENLLVGNPIYGADTEGSVWDPTVHEFNMNELGTVLDETKVDGKLVPGVNTVYLYFGMYRTSFPWHSEDMDLYSINYLHFGAPKYWFAIPPESADRFERFMCQQYPEHHGLCKAFLRHKHHLVTTAMLRANNIPYGTMVQRPGEFIITFPKGYHMGFNTGYNLAESTNFALDRWIDFGKNALVCKCRPDVVQIDMIPFMKKYRPQEFAQWHAYWYEPRIYQAKKGKKAVKRKTPTGGLPSSAECSPTKQWSDHKRRRLNGEPADVQQDYQKVETENGPIYTLPVTVEESHQQPLPPPTTTPTSSRSPIVQRTSFSTSLYDVKSALEPCSSSETLRNKWKRFFLPIWASSPVNLFMEKEYNSEEAKHWPHCAVCSYMQPLHMRPKAAKVPQRSRRLLNANSFAKYALAKEEIEEVDEQLLTCDNCHVVVHPSCYAGDDVASILSSGAPWKCLRCRKPASDVVIRSSSCSLCEIRGGALIPCKAGVDETYAHTVCALFNRRTTFDREIGPSSCYTCPPPKQGHDEPIRLPIDYVNVFGNDHERAKFECDLCGTSREGLIVCSICHETCQSNGTMPTAAHVTCARQVGFFLEQRDFPYGTVMICDRHNSTYLYEDVETNLSQIRLGDPVLMETEEHHVEKGNVEEVVEKKFAVIDFLDGSVSRDSSPKDITQCECIKCDKVSHQLGSRVEVQWNDDQTYSGYFRGLVDASEYKIRFPNGAYSNVRRGRIYARQDPMSTPMKRLFNLR